MKIEMDHFKIMSWNIGPESRESIAVESVNEWKFIWHGALVYHKWRYGKILVSSKTQTGLCETEGYKGNAYVKGEGQNRQKMISTYCHWKFYKLNGYRCFVQLSVPMVVFHSSRDELINLKVLLSSAWETWRKIDLVSCIRSLSW